MGDIQNQNFVNGGGSQFCILFSKSPFYGWLPYALLQELKALNHSVQKVYECPKFQNKSQHIFFLLVYLASNDQVSDVVLSIILIVSLYWDSVEIDHSDCDVIHTILGK